MDVKLEKQNQSSKHLLALAMGGFGIGLTEFVIMGLLPDVAKFFNKSIPEAGYLISAYALGVVIGAPILTMLGRKYSPKSLLLVFMLIFTLFNGLSALAPEYNLLMIFRFLSGLPHGAYFGVGAVVASRLAPQGKASAAVASMFVGLTVANFIGVPLATWLGDMYGWQWAFALVALVGIATVLSLKAWVPELPAVTGGSFKDDLKIFKSLEIWLCIFITAIGFGGFFAWISYISPLLTDVSQFSKSSVPLWMMLIGVGMTVGVTVGGKLADRMSPSVAGLLMMFGTMSCLLLSFYFAHVQWFMPILVFLTAAFAMSQCPPIQMLLIQNSKNAEMFGSSLGQSSFNIGNSLGAYFGGIPLLMGYTFRSPLLVGVAMSIIGIFFCIMLIRVKK